MEDFNIMSHFGSLEVKMSHACRQWDFKTHGPVTEIQFPGAGSGDALIDQKDVFYWQKLYNCIVKAGQ